MQDKISSEKQIKSSPSFFNNPHNRSIIYQVLLFLILGYFLYSIVDNTLTNMEARGIKSGFGFLGTTAGFDILMSLIPYDATYTYSRTFLVGLLNTLLVSALGIFFATIIGFIVGIAYFSHNWLIRKISVVYVETFRNIPLLLQVFFWYGAVLAALPSARDSLSVGEVVFLNIKGLFLPALVGSPGSIFVHLSFVFAIVAIVCVKWWAKKRQDLTGEQFPVFYTSTAIFIGLPLLALLLTGVPFSWDIPALKGFGFQGGITVIPELMALALSLSIYTGAFIAEAVRAGIQSVPHGQTEAARSVGLRENRIMTLIIVPQAMRVIVPLLNSEYQSLVKNSTLATAIGYPDLFNVFVGTSLNQTGQAIEIIFSTILVYLLVNMIISLTMNQFNRGVSLVEKK